MRVERLGVRLHMDALPLVFLSKDVAEAMALGLVRRMVLVPAAWAIEMPLEMLEAVVAHELAHLKRMDLWAMLLQRILETLFFFTRLCGGSRGGSELSENCARMS